MTYRWPSGAFRLIPRCYEALDDDNVANAPDDFCED